MRRSLGCVFLWRTRGNWRWQRSCDADGVDYVGESRIDGVPGSASPILLHFLDVAGSSCGALLPTGRVRDRFDGVEVTCIDNGMPVILLRACDLGCTGYETREQLDNDDALKRRLESIRLQAGPLMQLGDVSQRTVPKMTLIAEPRHGGAISSRTFIPTAATRRSAYLAR